MSMNNMTKKQLIEFLSQRFDDAQTFSLDIHMPISEPNAGGIRQILRPDKIKVLITEDTEG